MSEDSGAAPAGKRRSRGTTGHKFPATEKRLAANRRNALKHGQAALVLTPEEIRKGLLEKIRPGAGDILDHVFESAVATGDLTELGQVGARAMMETEILRRVAVVKIAEDGITVNDELMTREGEVYGHRIKAHPLLKPVLEMTEKLGFTAEQMQLSKRSKGEGAKDQAIVDLLEHRKRLVAARGRMLPEAKPAIDVTPVTR